MRIDRIRVFRTPLRLVEPLCTSDGVHESRNATLIELTDSNGIVGWGENVAPSGVAYVGESAEVSFKAMTELLAPCLTGRDI